MGVGDVYDIHAYPGPATPPADPDRALVLGEFGGLGLALPGLTWQDEANWGYREFTDRVELLNAYADLVTKLRTLMVEQGLSAAVYTQTTDVEIEVNGALTYDRSLAKLEPTATKWANRILYRPLPTTVMLSPTSENEGVRLALQLSKNRRATGRVLSSTTQVGWKARVASVSSTPRAARPRTEWTSRDVWLRRNFELDSLPRQPFLRVHHDENAGIYLNSELLKELPYYTFAYVDAPLDAAATSLFREGTNVLSVHCKRVGPGAYCDVGLYDTLEKIGVEKRGNE